MRTKTLIIAVAFTILASATAYTQESRPAERGAGSRPQEAGRNGLLRSLDLTKEQLEMVRKVNRERRASMERATQRLREANRLLDEAIYADSFDESSIKSRTAEAQTAQSEVISLRTQMEFEIRKILTPDQLRRFRSMRQRREDGPGARPGPRRNDRVPGMRPGVRPGVGGRPPRGI